MMNFPELPSAPSDHTVPFTDQLRLAVAAYLARFKGTSREHTASDLRCYLGWCAERGLDPLAVRRPYLELYIRWMQEVRRFKPSTVSRRLSVAAGFYKTCVIDGLLEHSPAERPSADRAGRVTDARIHAPAVRGSAGRWSPVGQSLRLRPGGDAGPPGFAYLRSHQRLHRRPRRGTRPPGPAGVRQGHQGRLDPAAACGRQGDRSGRWHPDKGADPAQLPRQSDGPARRHPPAAAA